VRPAVVWLTNSLLLGVAPAVRERLGVPVICTLQGEESWIEGLGPAAGEVRRLLRQHAPAVDRFVAPSAAYAGEMAAYLDVPRDRLRIVRPGVDVRTYAGGWQPAPRPFRVAYLSRLAPEKGIADLAEAVRRLEADRPGEIELLVAGQAAGPDRAHWQEVRRELAAAGLDGAVRDLGEVSLAGKVHLLQRAHVVVQPSRFPERRGMAAIEALAAGTPVVVPELGVFPELVELTGGGVLVPPEDPAALAQTLRSLQDAPDELARLGQAAARAAREHLTLEVMAGQAARVVEEVLEAPWR
jgi:glycosyltransferase involved in cell wall biosynthesis